MRKLICKYKSRNASGGTRAEFYARKDEIFDFVGTRKAHLCPLTN